MISAQLLEKFKEIYREAFKEDLSDVETLGKAQNIINLYEILYETDENE